MNQITPKLFSDSYFVKVPILSFLAIDFTAIKYFLLLFFPSKGCIFSLQNVCLARVTTRFLLIFKYLSITCCHANKQIKIDGKNDPCVTKESKLLYLSCDAKDCKHYCCQANNQIKIGGKNNPCVTKGHL